MNIEQYHDFIFGPGSWKEMEQRVLERLKTEDPFLYAMLKEENGNG